MTILLGYQHDRMCPKCHYMMGTTAYHQGFHSIQPGCPIGPTYGPPTPPWNYALDQKLADERKDQYQQSMERWIAQRDEIPEHFDRECPNCKYRWAEAVA